MKRITVYAISIWSSIGMLLAQDSYTSLRRAMVENQIQARGVSDLRTLTAMLNVPRHKFVPEDIRHLSYLDRPLPIGSGQTISQP